MAATAPESATTSANARPRQPIWLRCEKKPFEHRSALTPTTAKKLLDSNFDVYVEKDPQRIFDDSEFEACVWYFLFKTAVGMLIFIFFIKQCRLQDCPSQHLA